MEFDQTYTNYQLNRGMLRKIVRRVYLYFYRFLGKGVAVDFGCGIGELLAILPKGSRGLEINQASVRYCQKQGLHVDLYNPSQDNYLLSQIPDETFSTFFICEVLEHLTDPANVLKRILQSCHKKGFKRVVVVLPGIKGFRFDSTHKTFIDETFLKTHRFHRLSSWKLNEVWYFPVNHRGFGKYFTYNQMIVVFDRKN